MNNRITIDKVKELINENLKKAKSLDKHLQPEGIKRGVIEDIKYYIINKGLQYKDMLKRFPALYSLSKKIYGKLMDEKIKNSSRSEIGYVSICLKDIKSLMELDGEEFIYEAYKLILKREPDDKGLQTYRDILHNGEKRNKYRVIRALGLSQEAKEKGIVVELLFRDRFFIKLKSLIKSIPLFGRLAQSIYNVFVIPSFLKSLNEKIDLLQQNENELFAFLKTIRAENENVKEEIENVKEEINTLNDKITAIQNSSNKELDFLKDRFNNASFKLNWILKILNQEEEKEPEITQELLLPFSEKRFIITGSARDESVMGDLRQSEGYYEIHIMKLLQKIINKDSICLDIGAHIGVLSMVIAHLAPEGKVYAFEPSKYNYKFILENLRTNRISNVIPLNLGVYNKNGEMEFVYRKFFSGGSHLSIKGINDGVKETVKCITINDWVREEKLNKIDLIKLDVEGAEVMVIEGAKETLKRFHPDLVVEYNIYTMEKYFGLKHDELFLRLQELYPNIYLVRREDSSLLPLKKFEELMEFIKNGSEVEDLFATFKSINV